MWGIQSRMRSLSLVPQYSNVVIIKLSSVSWRIPQLLDPDPNLACLWTQHIVKFPTIYVPVYTGCGDGIARCFDAKAGTLKRTFKGHESTVGSSLVNLPDLLILINSTMIFIYNKFLSSNLVRLSEMSNVVSNDHSAPQYVAVFIGLGTVIVYTDWTWTWSYNLIEKYSIFQSHR